MMFFWKRHQKYIGSSGKALIPSPLDYLNVFQITESSHELLKKLLKAPNPPEGGGGRGPPKELYEQACVRNFIIVQWFIANRCKLFWSKLQIGTYASYDPYVCRKKSLALYVLSILRKCETN